ncbi:Trehalose utilization [Rubripirellula obstinata]|uniref:Trehalose utilization n=1 Tax=Rubripirellula obstinata TaxID=406547 RepID=A0A5B1CGU3_9BACT|nr:ThuA domain-containing protein [Rubripirellula obstinata]KAA1259776.1 Trehalose utilization [Rubripirellula obstinata]
MKAFSYLFLIIFGFTSVASAEDKIRVLIIDGQNNHDTWPKTTMMMKSFLEETDRFTVDIERTQFTWKGGELLEEFPLDDGKQYEDLPKPKTDPDFKPNFANYDVVLSNFGYNAAAWPDETKAALEAFVGGGGGMVVVHAADNSFGDWEEFNQMIGLGGWGGRNEKSGPYVYLNEDEEIVRDESKGNGGDHGPRHEYQVVIREPDHPIVAGLPRAWMHTKDELYQKLRGPANNMTILATAYADPKYKGTGRHEPIVMTIDYKGGRVFHTVMGHDDQAMACVGYATLLVRGTEWAADGKVTLNEVPDDFPTSTESKSRPFEMSVSQ